MLNTIFLLYCMKLSHINHDEKIYTAVFLNFILTSRIKVIIKNILTEMADYLNVSQMRKLQDVILKEFSKGEEAEKKEISNDEFLKMFIAAKEIEGISQRTSAYYRI